MGEPAEVQSLLVPDGPDPCGQRLAKASSDVLYMWVLTSGQVLVAVRTAGWQTIERRRDIYIYIYI